MFTAGDLALYFGFASELNSIRLKNPNLNFDVAPILQSRTGNRKITYGRTYGLAIVRSSRNVAGAYTAILGLSAPDSVQSFARTLGTPPVRRSLLNERPSDAYLQTFYDSALWSQAWIDPNTTETNLIFKNLIETVTAGRARLETALNRADRELQDLIRRQ
jgi:ABC-type glycerol-3-phosphate transport system substrate-binding protein